MKPIHSSLRHFGLLTLVIGIVHWLLVPSLVQGGMKVSSALKAPSTTLKPASSQIKLVVPSAEVLKPSPFVNLRKAEALKVKQGQPLSAAEQQLLKERLELSRRYFGLRVRDIAKHQLEGGIKPEALAGMQYYHFKSIGVRLPPEYKALLKGGTPLKDPQLAALELKYYRKYVRLEADEVAQLEKGTPLNTQQLAAIEARNAPPELLTPDEVAQLARGEALTSTQLAFVYLRNAPRHQIQLTPAEIRQLRKGEPLTMAQQAAVLLRHSENAASGAFHPARAQLMRGKLPSLGAQEKYRIDLDKTLKELGLDASPELRQQMLSGMMKSSQQKELAQKTITLQPALAEKGIAKAFAQRPEYRQMLQEKVLPKMKKQLSESTPEKILFMAEAAGVKLSKERIAQIQKGELPFTTATEIFLELAAKSKQFPLSKAELRILSKEKPLRAMFGPEANSIIHLKKSTSAATTKPKKPLKLSFSDPKHRLAAKIAFPLIKRKLSSKFSQLTPEQVLKLHQQKPLGFHLSEAQIVQVQKGELPLAPVLEMTMNGMVAEKRLILPAVDLKKLEQGTLITEVLGKDAGAVIRLKPSTVTTAAK